MALKLPNKLRAGDSFIFTGSVSEYPASVWTMTLKIANQNAVYTVTGSADGDNHLLSVAYTATAKWKAGKYRIIAQVFNGSEKYTIATGDFELLPDLVNQTDGRHHVEKVLGAIEAVLEGKATTDHLSMSFNGRNIQRFTPEQLLYWRDKYKVELAQLRAAERVAKGLPSGRKILTRFV